jgi:CBS domain-containing protein
MRDVAIIIAGGVASGVPRVTVADRRRLCLQWRHFTSSNRHTSARGSAVKLHDSVGRILRQKGSEVYSISPDATVFEALETLEEKNVGALLVMAGDNLVGLLSERDYVRKVKLRGHSSTELKVSEIMSTSVVTVTPAATVDECMRYMTIEHCRHLPVLDEGKVVGLVSIGDLVNWIMTVQDVTIHQLEDYICGKYPA